VVTGLLSLPGTWQVVARTHAAPKYFIRTRDDGATHTEAAHIPGGRSLRDLVFGANDDGLVAAFAVVSGVHGRRSPRGSCSWPVSPS